MTLAEYIAQYNQPFSEEMIQELQANEKAILTLIKVADFSLEWIITKTPEERNHLYENLDSFTLLVTMGGSSFEELMAMDEKTRQELYQHSNKIAGLVNTSCISLKELMAMDKSRRDELYQYAFDITRLVGLGFISFEMLMAEKVVPRRKLFKNSSLLFQLIKADENNYKYLITHKIIALPQLLSILTAENKILTICELAQHNLINSGIIPQGYKLKAENLSDLVKQIQGIAEVRKQARILAQPVETNSRTSFKFFPDHLRQTIAGWAGNDKADETSIAIQHYKKLTG